MSHIASLLTYLLTYGYVVRWIRAIPRNTGHVLVGVCLTVTISIHDGGTRSTECRFSLFTYLFVNNCNCLFGCYSERQR